MAEKKIKARLEELRGLDEAALRDAIVAAQKTIYQFRKDRLSKPIEDVKAVRNSRKEIARIKTIQRQRELGIGAKG